MSNNDPIAAAPPISTWWDIRADTGGTFTDCVGVAPDGAARRAKTLSSGILRATITGRRTENSVEIAASWLDDVPDDFLAGWPLRARAGVVAVESRILAHFGRTVILEQALPDSVGASLVGASVEIDPKLEAPIVAARLLTRTRAQNSLPPLRLRLATTRGTNALLTRSGAPPALFVTEGFGDLLLIGNQQRPDLFALDIVRPEPLIAESVPVAGRIAADGTEIRPLDTLALRDAARDLLARGVTSAAVALVHANVNPAHERRVGEILRDAGLSNVVLSHEIAPRVGLLARATTAVVDAYLAPILGAYLANIRRELPPESVVHVMTSAGALVDAASFRACDSLLSGPAGGIVGAANAAWAANIPRALAFDMGGTSTDVSRIVSSVGGDATSEPALEYVFEHAVGDARLAAPALAIESVAAGGGSICSVDSTGGLCVGPESAGARPGPACYGNGGPLTITDINLLLGRIDPGRFEIPLDPDAANARLGELVAKSGASPGELLDGFTAIADEAMASAIRSVSVRRGFDPSDYALIGFGGAGGQHACGVADRLGISTIVIPPDQSLLSAVGLGAARISRFAERQFLTPLSSVDVESEIARLHADVIDRLRRENGPRASVSITRRLARLRLAGQESTLDLEIDDPKTLREDFLRAFSRTFGHPPPVDAILELESLRVLGVVDEPAAPVSNKPPVAETGAVGGEIVGESAPGIRRISRDRLRIGDSFDGPALVVEPFSTTFVAPGWRVRIDNGGALILESTGETRDASSADSLTDAARATLFARRFESVAAEMGEMLRRTALSVNVRERLDFSCALLSPDGNLVAAAAHIPVHLGALSLCARTVFGPGGIDPASLADGDSVIVNHPAFGGSHLPDITVLTPVKRHSQLLGFVASRAHHAELGGTRPGSMPPDATTLREEGVVIAPTVLRAADDIRAVLVGGPFPTRALSDNLADIDAALAANRRGQGALRELADSFSPEVLLRWQRTLATSCETAAKGALADFARATLRRDVSGESFLDDGHAVRVRVRIEPDGLSTFDFTGSSGTHPGNFNAPPAVTNAAVLFVLKVLLSQNERGASLPLNEGLLRAVRLILPENSIVNPTFFADPARCPAVVGGNTEVSQRIVDALFRALGLSAGSQATMNNVLFGAGKPGDVGAFGYYETLCGGAGATSNRPGASAVHTHMTNTRIADVEVLERRYPVVLERFERRRGSGGAGENAGGDGVVREYRFLADVALSLLCHGRISGGFGASGGGDGAAGAQWIVRNEGGAVEPIAGVSSATLFRGDRLVVQTPGGGGFGGC